MDPHGRWTLLDPLDALQGLPLKCEVSGAAGSSMGGLAGTGGSNHKRERVQRTGHVPLR